MESKAGDNEQRTMDKGQREGGPVRDPVESTNAVPSGILWKGGRRTERGRRKDEDEDEDEDDWLTPGGRRSQQGSCGKAVPAGILWKGWSLETIASLHRWATCQSGKGLPHSKSRQRHRYALMTEPRDEMTKGGLHDITAAISWDYGRQCHSFLTPFLLKTVPDPVSPQRHGIAFDASHVATDGRRVATSVAELCRAMLPRRLRGGLQIFRPPGWQQPDRGGFDLRSGLACVATPVASP